MKLGLSMGLLAATTLCMNSTGHFHNWDMDELDRIEQESQNQEHYRKMLKQHFGRR